MNSLAPSPIRAVFLAVYSSFLLPDSLFAQGSLTPPGAPAPTMKTLTEVEPRIAVQTLTGGSATVQYFITQPGSYYLTGNINSATGQTAIKILSDDVTLDLGGHALTGAAGSIIGVEIGGRNIVVRNGKIRGFKSAGVAATGLSSNCLAEDLTIQGITNGTGIVFIGATNYHARNCRVSDVGIGGISLGTGGLVENCVVSNVTGSGGVLAVTVGIGAATVTGSTVFSVTASPNVGVIGIQGSSVSNCSVESVTGKDDFTEGVDASTVTGCSISTVNGGRFSAGINASGGTVNGCSVSDIGSGANDTSPAFGISAGNASQCEVIRVGGTGSSAAPIGMSVSSASNCTVTQIGQTTSAVGATGVSGGVVTACNVSTVRGGSSGNVVGITGTSVSQCNVATLTQGASSGTVSGITADVVIGCRINSIAGSSTAAVSGIGASANVRDCSVANISNVGTGISGGLIRTSSNAGTVENCAFRICGDVGISVFARQRIVGCSVSQNTTGILATDVRNVIDGNNIDGTGAGSVGISAVSGGNTANALIVRNQVRQCATKIAFDAPCQVGPIVTTTGFIASTNPWANFTD